MTRNKLEFLPGTLDMLVLKTLAIGPQHGYGIARRIEQVSQEVLQVEEGSLYPALHRMEKKGWVSAEWGLSESNRKAKFYRLTRPGRRRLTAETESWERVSAAIGEVMRAQMGEA
jgi:PadR family transcriptional regulator PadR